MYERFGFKAVGHRRRYYQDNGEDAVVMESSPGHASDPRDRNQLRRHLRCGCSQGRDPLQRHLLAGRQPRGVRRGGARDRVPPSPRADQPDRGSGAGRGAGEPGRPGLDRGYPRPRPDRSPPGGRLFGEGAGSGPAAADGGGGSPPRSCRGQLPRARSARAAVPVPDRERWAHAPRGSHGEGPLRRPGPDARRCGGRGARQGGPGARASRIRAARRSSGSRRTAIPPRSSSRSR